MKLTTSIYADEIEWSIGCISPEGCHEYECRNNGNYDNNETYNRKCCLPVGNDDDDFVITCKDTYGDGWHGAYLQINEKNYCEKFSTGLLHQENLQNDFDIKGWINY